MKERILVNFILCKMLVDQYLAAESDVSSHRPDPLGQDTNYDRHSLGRPGKIIF